jgi:hypothetical protein
MSPPSLKITERAQVLLGLGLHLAAFSPHPWTTSATARRVRAGLRIRFMG